MQARVDPLRLALQVGLYIFFFILFLFLFIWSGLATLMGPWMGSAVCTFAAAILTNVLTLRIYEGRKLSDIGFHWTAASAWNLGLGLCAGILAASAVLTAPLVFNAASLQSLAASTPARTVIFTLTMLVLGAAGEEVLFRGYGFQVLLRSAGPFATILPVGVLFGALHTSN